MIFSLSLLFVALLFYYLRTRPKTVENSIFFAVCWFFLSAGLFRGLDDLDWFISYVDDGGMTLFLGWMVLGIVLYIVCPNSSSSRHQETDASGPETEVENIES